MIQRSENLRFALKTGHSFGVVGESLGQDLQCYVAAKLGIAGTIHLTHAACT